VESGRKLGHTFSQPDLIIAATGIQQGSTVVTRYAADCLDNLRSRQGSTFQPVDHERAVGEGDICLD